MEDGSSFYYSTHGIVKNRYGKNLAQSITFETKYTKTIVTREITNFEEWNGKIYLLPLLPDWSYKELVEEVIDKLTTPSSDPEEPPEWLEDYTLPREEEVLEEISELRHEIEEKQDQLEGLQKFKELLYENGRALEESVLEAFRDMGFKVEGEVMSGRDGSIELEDARIVLEIYGTTSGVTLEKCRELDDWVEKSIAENSDKDAYGLLIVNPMREDKPPEREDAIPPNVIDYMDRRNMRILQTVDLFRLLKGSRSGELTQADILDNLLGDEIIIELPDISLAQTR